MSKKLSVRVLVLQSNKLKWYRKAVDQNDHFAHFAQFNLGFCYENGQGVMQNYVEAAKWYRMAAEQGFVRAQKNLGACYERGLGVPKSQAEADKWFHKAAEQNGQ